MDANNIFYLEKIINGGIVHNIGQLSKENVNFLEKAVKKGAITKGKGGCFPTIKTVYAPIGFNFTEHRQQVINDIKKLTNDNSRLTYAI